MAFCVSCGHAIVDKFCGNCGAPGATDQARAPEPPRVDYLGNSDPAAETGAARWALPRRAVIAIAVAVALVLVSVPTALAYRHHQRAKAEASYLHHLKGFLRDNQMMSHYGSDIDRLLLATGYGMCDQIEHGTSIGTIMDRWTPKMAPLPANETVRDFANRISGPITQVAFAGVAGVLSAQYLCPGPGKQALKKFHDS